MAPEEDPDQLEFRNGELVARDPPAEAPGKARTDPVVPNEETGFSVAIKPGALQVNEAIEQARAEYGRVLTFGSRADAEAWAQQCGADGGALRVQAAAPNDTDDVDAYLLAAVERSVTEPASTDGDTWTFDVGANLYGALGETVVTTGSTPPALSWFVRQDLDELPDDLDERLHITVRRDRVVSVGDGEHTWRPDCVVEARDGWNGDLLERYWCEIKTGEASFERSQRQAMQQLATDERVLTIRVLIEALPDQYALRIHEVTPDTDGSD